MQALQTKLYYYAGSINKLNVDDKGITLVAGLGLPPLSHKDDAARAVHAALEMQAALRDLGRPSAIGITTGFVFCGPIGNARRREYTMVGNVVNMSARLMQAAEVNLIAQKGRSTSITADILIDESTQAIIQQQIARGQELANQLDFERLPALYVKGKIEAVTVFRPNYRNVTRGRQHQARNTVFIGHEAEQNALQKLLRDWNKTPPDKRKTIFFIEGEAGVGKSLIIDGLRKQASARQMPILFGSGRALDRTAVFHAWKPIFHQIFKLDEVFHDPASLRNQVLGQLPTLRSERGFPGLALRLSALLNPILPFDFPESELTRPMDMAKRRRMTQLLLLRLFENEVNGRPSRPNRSDSPHLLIMESGQWLDEYSWELLRMVNQRIPNLVIVVATRPLQEEALAAPLPKACRSLFNSKKAQKVSISLLSPDQIAALLCQKERIASLPEVMTAVLSSRTGGHPLYSEELIAHWQNHKRNKMGLWGLRGF
jgi:hypothetical protein